MQDELGQKILMIMEKLIIIEEQVKELRKLFKHASEETRINTFTYDGAVMFRHRNLEDTQDKK